jgi:hypothetical protein
MAFHHEFPIPDLFNHYEKLIIVDKSCPTRLNIQIFQYFKGMNPFAALVP